MSRYSRPIPRRNDQPGHPLLLQAANRVGRGLLAECQYHLEIGCCPFNRGQRGTKLTHRGDRIVDAVQRADQPSERLTARRSAAELSPPQKTGIGLNGTGAMTKSSKS